MLPGNAYEYITLPSYLTVRISEYNLIRNHIEFPFLLFHCFFSVQSGYFCLNGLRQADGCLNNGSIGFKLIKPDTVYGPTEI